MSPSDGVSITPPLDRAIESVLGAVAAPDRCPSGASFIAADLPSFHSHFRRAISEDRPVVVVLPDGDELLIEPRSDGFSRIVRRARRMFAGTAFAWLAPTPRPRDAGPLIRSGARGEPFDVPLVRLSVAGYDTHLHGLRRQA
jgi:uncharacterized protein with von Willebrand factor type A (vWA) domain